MAASSPARFSPSPRVSFSAAISSRSLAMRSSASRFSRPFSRSAFSLSASFAIASSRCFCASSRAPASPSFATFFSPSTCAIWTFASPGARATIGGDRHRRARDEDECDDRDGRQRVERTEHGGASALRVAFRERGGRGRHDDGAGLVVVLCLVAHLDGRRDRLLRLQPIVEPQRHVDVAPPLAAGDGHDPRRLRPAPRAHTGDAAPRDASSMRGLRPAPQGRAPRRAPSAHASPGAGYERPRAHCSKRGWKRSRSPIGFFILRLRSPNVFPSLPAYIVHVDRPTPTRMTAGGNRGFRRACRVRRAAAKILIPLPKHEISGTAPEWTTSCNGPAGAKGPPEPGGSRAAVIQATRAKSRAVGSHPDRRLSKWCRARPNAGPSGQGSASRLRAVDRRRGQDALFAGNIRAMLPPKPQTPVATPPIAKAPKTPNMNLRGLTRGSERPPVARVAPRLGASAHGRPRTAPSSVPRARCRRRFSARSPPRPLHRPPGRRRHVRRR